MGQHVSVLKTVFFLLIFFSFQLKNAFDNLFEGLMESKDGEKEAAVVGIITCFCLQYVFFFLL